MKRLPLLLIILLIGCTDPIDDFDIHVTPEAQEIPKLASDQWNMKEALTNSELKEAIPEFLGSLNIESNVVHEQTSGITVGWTPIIKGRSVNALLLTTGKKDNWQHKLIIRQQLDEYYKLTPNHKGLPKKAILQAFEFHEKQLSSSDSKEVISIKNSPATQINHDSQSESNNVKREFVEICGYELAYSYKKIVSGVIVEQIDTYYYICEYHYIEDSPGDPVLLDDMPGGGGSSSETTSAKKQAEERINKITDPDERRKAQLDYLKSFGGQEGKDFAALIESLSLVNGLTENDIKEINKMVQSATNVLINNYFKAIFGTVIGMAKPFIELGLASGVSNILLQSLSALMQTKWGIDLLRSTKQLRRIRSNFISFQHLSTSKKMVEFELGISGSAFKTELRIATGRSWQATSNSNIFTLRNNDIIYTYRPFANTWSKGPTIDVHRILTNGQKIQIAKYRLNGF